MSPRITGRGSRAGVSDGRFEDAKRHGGMFGARPSWIARLVRRWGAR